MPVSEINFIVWQNGLKRRVKVKVGGTYRIDGMEKNPLQNQGRPVQIVSLIDNERNGVEAIVRFLDTDHQESLTDCSSLVPINA